MIKFQSPFEVAKTPDTEKLLDEIEKQKRTNVLLEETLRILKVQLNKQEARIIKMKK